MKSRAFTLIELLVVISIIGLLSSIVLAALNTARNKGSTAAGQTQSTSIFHTLADAEILQLDFNECSGATAYDLSGSGNNAAITGVPTWVSSYSTPGCALSLDGIGKYATVASLSTLQSTNTTFSAWIYPTDVSGNAGIIEKETQYKYLISAGVLRGLASCDGVGWTLNMPGGTVAPNKWYFAVFVVDSTNQKLYTYLNGTQVASGSLGCSITGFNVNPVGVGWRGFGGSDAFTGLIDEAHIYTRTLTAMEIKQTFLAGIEKHGMKLADLK